MNLESQKLSWLAGIIDGEGCIGLYSFLSHGKYKEIRTQIIIVSTNYLLILEVRKILDGLKISYCVGLRKRIKPNWKQSYYIQMQNIPALKKFLPFLLSYLIVKQKQAKIIQKFCNRRRNSSYLKNEFRMVNQIKLLNKKGYA